MTTAAMAAMPMMRARVEPILIGVVFHFPYDYA